MKNWKRILAAVGTAALLVSNVGAVSQVVFADEGDIVESVADGVVDVSQENVSAQVQEIIDEAIAVSEEPSDESKSDQPEIPAESTEVITEGTTESEPAEETPAPTDPIETPEPVEGDETSTDDETVSDEPTTTEDDEEIGDETVEDETVVDETTVDETVEDETDVDEETEEEPLVSPEYEKEVPVTSKDGSESGITVKATAEANVIPDGAILVARLIEEDTKEYQEVEQALIDSEDVDYTGETQTADTSDDADDEEDAGDSETVASEGFIAMDIHFEVKQPVKTDEAQTEDAENVDDETEDAENVDAQDLEDADDETNDETDIEYEYVEVEPKGFVNITFDLAQDVLPVEADTSTLTVHHIVEDEDGNVEKIETVADTKPVDEGGADGDVKAGDAPDEDTSPEVKAEFQVESFSTYVLKWDGGQTEGKVEYVFIHYVDEDGKDVAGQTGVTNMGTLKNEYEKTLDMASFAKTVSGYSLSSIKIQGRGDKDHNLNPDDPDGHEAINAGVLSGYPSAQFIRWNDGGNKADAVHYYRLAGYNGDDEEQFEEVGDCYQTADVYLVYKKNPDPDPTKIVVPGVSGVKTVTANTDAENNTDGTYDLNLSVSTTGTTSKEKQQVDLLFVLDTSSSMIKNWSGGKSRGEIAEQAIIDACTALSRNTNVDAQYGFITFSTYVSLTDAYGYTPYKYGDYLKYDGSYYKIDLNTHYSREYKAFKGYVYTEDANGEWVKVDGLTYPNTDDGYFIKYDEDYDGGRAQGRYIYGNYGAGQKFSSAPLTKTQMDDINYGGNTNYQAAMIGTSWALSGARAEAKKIVIFMSDGIPTQAFNPQGGLWGDGTEKSAIALGDNNGDNFTTRAVKEMKSLNLSSTTKDAFYTVAIGTNVDMNKWKTFIQPMTNKNNYKDPNITTGSFLVDSDDSSKIAKQLTDILDKEMKISASNVTIEDPLSENVEIVSGSKLTVKITDANGKEIETQTVISGTDVAFESDGKTYKVTPKVENGKVILDLQDDYTLDNGWTYSITAKIKPTATALSKYRTMLYEGTDYPDTADKGTGTYEGLKGFYTNQTETVDDEIQSKAVITYSYTGTDGNQVTGTHYYYKPVIQLDDSGSIVIKKTITGLTTADLVTEAEKNTQFAVTVTIPAQDGGSPTEITQTIALNDTASNVTIDKDVTGLAAGTVTYTIKCTKFRGLDTGASYTVTEQNPDNTKTAGDIGSKGYDVITTSTGDDGSIVWGENTATFINAYSKKIVKTGVVTDSNMFPALVATIDIMAAMFVVYGIAKRRVH